jgi:hypothetical protein
MAKHGARGFVMTNCEELSTTEKTECWVREYFEFRDWSVEKLDLGKEGAADFQICKDANCFLCEVKTVESVHANYPWSPSLDVHNAERKKRQDSYKQWIEENPDSRLVLNPTEYDFVYGDPSKFKRKYKGRARFTEEQFNKFSNDMHDYFARSTKVQHLPFSIRLDSDDLYVPYGDERKQFFEWLENELIAIVNKKRVDRRWHFEKLPYGSAFRLSMFYPIHQSKRENDVDADYQLSITGPNYSNKLDIQIFSYGQLNLDAITQNIEGGLRQLSITVSRDRFQGDARVISLAFGGGLSFEWEALLPHISWLLLQNKSLDAIAVLDRVPKVEPPNQQQEGIEAFLSWISSSFNQPWETRFIVFHNTWRPNEHMEMISQAFHYHKNRHIESHKIEIPRSWLLE